MSLMFNLVGSDTNPMFSMPWYWHLVLGGYAFGLVYMVTEPVSAAMTNIGRWWYAALIGAMCVLIRVVNPAFPEGHDAGDPVRQRLRPGDRLPGGAGPTCDGGGAMPDHRPQ